MYLIKFIYMTILLPPGSLIALFLILWFYLRKRNKRAAAMLLALNLVLYLLSVGLVSDTLVRSLEKRHSLPEKLEGDLIIMLGGGTTPDTPGLHGKGNLSSYASNRLLTSIQLYNKLHVPILVSGGKVFEHTGTEGDIARDILVSIGISKDQVIVDDKSLNTEQNALNCAEITKKYGFKKPILVTSAFHMPRSMMLFNRLSVDCVPFPSDYQVSIKQHVNIWSFIPEAGNLNKSSLAIKEYLGMLR